jgi:hypothetical protein
VPRILSNPNQLRANGVTGNDVTKHLSQGISSHSIEFINEDIKLPLQLKGIISYLPVCMPMQKEEPYSEEFEENEHTFTRKIPINKWAIALSRVRIS